MSKWIQRMELDSDPLARTILTHDFTGDLHDAEPWCAQHEVE